jgi:hypothetical protein
MGQRISCSSSGSTSSHCWAARFSVIFRSA